MASRRMTGTALNSVETRVLRNRKTESRTGTVKSVPNLSGKTIKNNEKSGKSFKPPEKRIKLAEVLNPDEILASSLRECSKPLNHGLERVKDSFFDIPSEELAKALLGQILVRRLEDGTILKGRIVETECYPGGEDKASLTYNGRITEKCKALYMKPGTTYVYLTYGMYHCFNISSKGPGAAVLLRAIDPLEGFDYMKDQRGKKRKATVDLKPHELCNGPSKLCMSFNITKVSCNVKDLTVWDEMWIEKDETFQSKLDSHNIVASRRIGIDAVGIEWASKPFRFYILGDSSVSKRDKIKELELTSKSVS